MRKGFTLVELLLVIVLISVISALSVPRFKSSAAEFRLKSEAFTLYKVIQFARERALVEGREIRIRFDFDAGHYQLLRGPDFTPIEGRFGKTKRIAADLSLEGSEPQVNCFPDGNCGTVFLRVRGEDATYEVSIQGLGGLTRVRELPQ